ncbi:MAG: SlyX family protein [Deltaproteobacteria bacterium]|nr:SlyX family protein [Deltaproteobacteria bacterium]
MEERLIDLETKAAFQEALIQELRASLDDHWLIIDRLSKEMKDMGAKLSVVEPLQLMDAKDEGPPPHY